MNWVWQWTQHPVAERLGWILLHSLWQVGFVGILFAVVRLGLRRYSANARYVAGCLALAASVALPVLTVMLLSEPWTPHPGLTIVAGLSEAPLAIPVWRSSMQEPAGTNAFSAFLQTISEFLSRMTPGLAAAWLLGVALGTLRLTRDWWSVRRVCNQGKTAIAGELVEKLNDLRLRLGISRPVRLFKSALVEVPTVIGWLRPVILLPAATLGGLTPLQLETILTHELAHIRRMDYLVNLFQCVVETLMFYHPVVHWISACLREERENCCDDVVLGLFKDPILYARALASLEQTRVAYPRWSFAVTGGSLILRIRRLLGLELASSHLDLKRFCGLAFIGVGFVFIGLGAFLLNSPLKYQGVARLRVTNKSDGQTRFAETGQQSAFDPYFLQTEMQILSSVRVLEKVADDLQLGRKWGQKDPKTGILTLAEATSRLRHKVAVHLIRNTSLFEISVSSEDPAEAALLANAIAEAYRKLRLDDSTIEANSGYVRLMLMEKDQNEKVREIQARVDALRQELQIPDAMQGLEPPISAETLRRIEAIRLETRMDLVRQEALLNNLRQLRRDLGEDRMMESMPIITEHSVASPDQLLATLLEQFSVADQRLTLLGKEYGPEHTEMMKAKAQVADLRARITGRVDGILLGLEAKVSSLKKVLEELQLEIVKIRENDTRQATAFRPYFEAKQRLDDEIQLRKILQTKIAAEKVDLSFKTKIQAEVVDAAAIPRLATSPNTPQGLTLISLGLLLEALGLVLLRTKAPITPTLCPA